MKAGQTRALLSHLLWWPCFETRNCFFFYNEVPHSSFFFFFSVFIYSSQRLWVESSHYLLYKRTNALRCVSDDNSLAWISGRIWGILSIIQKGLCLKILQKVSHVNTSNYFYYVETILYPEHIVLQRTQKWPDGILSVLGSVIAQNSGTERLLGAGTGPALLSGARWLSENPQNTDGLIPKFKFCQIAPLWW